MEPKNLTTTSLENENSSQNKIFILRNIRKLKNLIRKGNIVEAINFIDDNKKIFNPLYVNNRGENLLYFAIDELTKKENNDDDFLNLITKLIEVGVEININSTGPYADTVLGLALFKGPTFFEAKNAVLEKRIGSLVSLLLKNEADVNLIPASENISILMRAGFYIRDVGIFKEILYKSFNINDRSIEMYYDSPLGLETAAHWAANGGRIDYLEMLYSRGADFLIQDACDNTPFEQALSLDAELGSHLHIKEVQESCYEFLNNHLEILEKEYARLEDIKNNNKSTFLTTTDYSYHEKYHDYIISIRSKINLEQNITSKPLSVNRNKIKI